MSIAKNVSLASRDDRKVRQGYVDLKKATAIELEELIERQEKLLRNRAFINKLPDKGKKIIAFRDEVQNELTNRQKMYDSACTLLSNLKLSEINSTEDLEWNGGKIPDSKKKLDSDDEDEEEYFSASEIDPLKILANHSGTKNSVKKKLSQQSSELLNGQANYVNKMCKKYDSVVETKERFKPNQLKENNKNLFQTSAEKLKERLGDKWEVTEATPPVFKLNNVKSITLMESINLQKAQAEKLKETEKKHAAEKLLLNMNLKMGDKLPVAKLDEYREQGNDFDESANDEESDDGSASDEN